MLIYRKIEFDNNFYDVYYIAIADIWIKNKNYSVIQKRYKREETESKWIVPNTEMISILRNTDDWLYSIDEEFKPADTNIIQGIIRDLQNHKATLVLYEQGTFNILGSGLYQCLLKPRR